MALSGINDVLDFEKYCELEIWVRGHSRSFKTSIIQ